MYRLLPALLVLSFFNSHILHSGNASAPITAPPHVCIIGAGISAASAAHFLSQNPSPSITIFDKNHHVGGRIQSFQLPNQNKPTTISIEAGASIIASDNQLMSYFANYCNLTRREPNFKTLALWDGHQFVFHTSPTKPATMLALLRRYKLSVPRTAKYVSTLLRNYAKLYPTNGVQSPWQAYSTVQSLLHRTKGLYNLTQQRFEPILKQLFSDKYIREFIAAITRVNYGQDVDQMNALSGAVALAGSGQQLWAVKGGNVQIVRRLLESSAAHVHLDTPIHKVTITHANPKNPQYQLHSGAHTWTCHAVILAAPLELANITLPDNIATRIPVGRRFQLTVATFIQGYVNKQTFGPSPPDAILTTHHVHDVFTSLSLVHPSQHNQPPIFKIFSPQLLLEHHIARLFEPGSKLLAQYPWMAYPKFAPPEIFADFDLHEHGAFIYTSPLESAGSAMEMSAVAGANAAALVRQKLDMPIHIHKQPQTIISDEL